MAEKRPQSTAVLVMRLQRVAKSLDKLYELMEIKSPSIKAQANTCWQAAARLQEFRDAQAEIRLDMVE